MYLQYLTNVAYVVGPFAPKLLAVSSSARLSADEDKGPGCCRCCQFLGNSQTYLGGQIGTYVKTNQCESTQSK